MFAQEIVVPRVDAVPRPDLPTAVALDRWEDEGGAIPPCRPTLPRAHVAQPAWGFRSSGSRSYDFHRVYGAPSRDDRRGPIRRLDEGLSFWSVTWPSAAGTAAEHPEGRWLTFAQAHRVFGPSMTFERFSSPSPMRGELEWFLAPDGA
jgi:hypothetical protein